MDPNTALESIRAQLKAFAALVDENFDLNELADNMVALDEWLSSGGFLPSDWAVNR
jgi:hypothetical protein